VRHRSPQNTGRGITYPDPEAYKRCLSLLLLGRSALLARILPSHDVGADDAPVRATYPARALVNELQRHGDGDGFMLFSQQAWPSSASLLSRLRKRR
jgi:hypothetical protein